MHSASVDATARQTQWPLSASVKTRILNDHCLSDYFGVFFQSERTIDGDVPIIRYTGDLSSKALPHTLPDSASLSLYFVRSVSLPPVNVRVSCNSNRAFFETQPNLCF